MPHFDPPSRKATILKLISISAVLALSPLTAVFVSGCLERCTPATEGPTIVVQLVDETGAPFAPEEGNALQVEALRAGQRYPCEPIQSEDDANEQWLCPGRLHVSNAVVVTYDGVETLSEILRIPRDGNNCLKSQLSIELPILFESP